MKILISSATYFEISPYEAYLRENLRMAGNYQYKQDKMEFFLLVTGVGLPLTAYSLGKLFAHHRFDLAINAGIAGAFNRELALGDVVQVVSERFGDLGVEDAMGAFTDVHQLGLIDPNQPPFQDGELINEPAAGFDFLPRVKGLSVNKVHGYPPNIEQIRKIYDADIESMEGAAFFYACLMENLPFLEIRSVSNYVEARNKANWDIPAALANLNQTLIEITRSLFLSTSAPFH